MSGPSLTIEIRSIDEAEHTLQALRNTLADRRPLHAEMAGNARTATQQYLRGLNRHRTAQRLGATPSSHYEKAANSIEAQSDDQAAIIRIPRRTGLGRAFGDVTITPRPGKTFLTIPAHSLTYGKSARDFPEGTFDFAALGRFRALLWADGPDKGKVAYWLKKQVFQKQDRTLLPSDDTFREIGRRTIIAHIAQRVYNA